MAYDYEKAKQLYQGMNKEQQQQFVDQNKNDANFQRFMWDYMNEINGKSTTKSTTPTTTPQVENNNANSNNQNGTNWQNNQQNETINQNTNQNQNNNQNQFDPNEKLDEWMFQTPANDKVVVKEGTAQQTWTPDYQLDSDARNKEITDNLNYYWQNNQDYFKDRATYNSIFHYDERSEWQKAILDSYWKKKDLQDSTIKYWTWDSIVQWMNDIDITEDQLNYIKANNEWAYREWQAKQQEMIDRIISNQSVPTVDEIVNKLTDYIDKLDLWSQRYDFMQYNEELKQQYQIDSKLSALEGTIANMQSDKAKIDSVITKYSNAWADTMGWAAANFARMQRALAPYNESFAKNAQIYSAQLQSYQMSAAQVKSDLNVMYQQTQEDQRVWNNRYQALGFAMRADSYRTPEQQAALQLKTQYEQWQISLLQQSQLNDLSLYNQYAQAKLQDQIQFERTDLEVEDENQRRTNLNNVLSQYYQEYGDIIQRSQAQALNDILQYAKDNNCTVWEALTQNFIKPLQSKKEYKAKLNQSYNLNWKQSITTINWRSAILTQNPDWTIRYDFIDEDTVWSMEDFLSWYKEWQKGWQCGKFVNDYLESMGLWRIFQNDIQDKLKVSEPYDADSLWVWDVVVFDYTWPFSMNISENSKKYWHVAIVKDIDRASGMMTIVESNYDGNETVHTRTVPLDNRFLKWMYSPKWVTSWWSYVESRVWLYDAYINWKKPTDALLKSMWNWNLEKWLQKFESEVAAYQEQTWYTTWYSQEAYDQVTDLRKEFRKTDAYKNYENAKNYYDQLLVTSKKETAAWDMAMIFAYMKMLDPWSVVREWEFASAQDATWVPQRIINQYNNAVNWTRLSSEQRKDFLSIAKDFYTNSVKDYNNELAEYQSYVTRWWNKDFIWTPIELNDTKKYFQQTQYQTPAYQSTLQIWNFTYDLSWMPS